MPMSRFRFLLAYFAVLALLMWKATLCPDGYYYWNWSEHLQLSYLDGSPLIAYVIRAYITVFGQHEFSLYLIGLTSAAVTGWLIYRITCLLFGTEAANMALPLWLLTPGVIRYFVFQITYNSIFIIFWTLTFYYFVKIMTSNQKKYFYLCGISIGLMLLSKYTGILLCAALFIICLCYSKYRFVFKSRHFYGALVVAFIIFSPVLIWNAQHHWISFFYQLHHGYQSEHANVALQLKHYIFSTIFDFNFPLFLLVLLSVINFKTLFREKYAILTIPTLFIWLFFFISSCFSMPQSNWSAPFYVTGVILLSGFLVNSDLKRYALAITLIIASLISLLLVLGNRFPALYLLNGPGWSGQYAMKSIMGKLDPMIYHDKIIFGDEYQLLSQAHYFLPGRPQVYSINLSANQYYFWWLLHKQQPYPNAAIYISNQPLVSSTENQLKDCKLLMQKQYIQPRLLHADYTWNLYVYNCYLQK